VCISQLLRGCHRHRLLSSLITIILVIIIIIIIIVIITITITNQMDYAGHGGKLLQRARGLRALRVQRQWAGGCQLG